jgi:DNA polymerase epsilon subunit 1
VGSTLQECYDACGEVGERWYDILDSKGEYIDDLELIEYIGEERVLSKGVHEYGDRKATSITCAKRLADFLGADNLKDDGGLNVKFIISKAPMDAKVADRAIPTAIFETDKVIKEKFLKKWLKD